MAACLLPPHERCYLDEQVEGVSNNESFEKTTSYSKPFIASIMLTKTFNCIQYVFIVSLAVILLRLL